MTRYLGTIVDILFVFAFVVLVPHVVGYIHHAAATSPNAYDIYVRIAIAAVMLHPVVCAVILQKIGTEPVLQKGLYSMNQFLKRWYAWPLGIIVWGLAIPAHTMAMTLATWSFAPGEILRSGGSKVDAAIFPAFLFSTVITWWIIFRILGVKKIFKGLKVSSPKVRWWLKAAIWMLVFLLFMVMGVSFLLIVLLLGLCLYAAVWIHASIRVHRAVKDGSEKVNIALLPDARSVRIASLIVLFTYTIIDAFYFETVVSGLSSRFYQSTLDLWLVAGGTIIMFYLPFRLFFALYSGRQWLGWITFALSALIVFLNIVAA